MTHYEESHQAITDGIKDFFDEVARRNPEPQFQGQLATLRELVHNFCGMKVPTNHDELKRLTAKHQAMLQAIETTASSIRRTKSWDRLSEATSHLVKRSS